MSATATVRRTVRWAVPAALLASAALLGLAPLFLPDSYSWVSMSTSESAAQGLPYAWIARAGLLCFASGVLRLCVGARGHWEASAVLLHAVFGVCLIGVAVFSHRPWQLELPYRAWEDGLHSLFATGMGFAFAIGVVTRWIQRRERSRLTTVVDAAAVFAATFLPIAGAMTAPLQGLLQRSMFAVAYVWYIAEAWRLPVGSSARNGT